MSPVDPLGGLGHPGHGGANLPGDPSPPTRRPPAGPGAPQGPRVGFRLQASGTPTAWALVLVLGGFFIAQCALGDWNMEDPLALFRLGALHWLSVLDGDFFRLGAYSFLHIGVAHFLLNAYALWILMRPIELSYGSVSALGIYAAAVIGGGAASMAWAIHSNNAFMLAAGASGGIFGLFGAQISLWLRLRSRLPPEASKLAVRGLVMNLLLNVFISWQAAANGMALDNSAHLGGIATGLFFGLAAPLAVLPGRFWQKPAQALLVLATFALASMEGAAVARAIHPHTRLLQGPGVAADAPWMLVPATPGIAVAREGSEWKRASRGSPSRSRSSRAATRSASASAPGRARAARASRARRCSRSARRRAAGACASK